MKLFKSLLVAPATLGLLAPMSATANEVTINDFNPAEELAITNSRVDGLEARLNNFEAGGFSETTTASFSADAVIGSIDGDTTSEAVTFDYQYNIGLSTSFTGEDSFNSSVIMDYKKKSLNKLNQYKDYEEIDTRLASGWYVDSVGTSKKKKYKTKEVKFKIAKKPL